MSSSSHSALNLAVIGGDGIGPEVTAEALKVMRAASAAEGDAEITATEYPLGAAHWLETGETLNDETIERLRGHDAILFGAVGAAPDDTRIPSGILERDVLLKLRFTFDHGVNIRPAVLYPGVRSPLAEPGTIDFVVFREGTEGLYVGNGGVVRQGTEQEIATESSVNTAYGVERVVRAAFEFAATRERKHVTLVHKHNVLLFAGRLWNRIVHQVAAEFPQVTHDYLHVDAATIFMTTDPGRFDVIVTDNMFGDIITDLAAAVTGGIGMAASGNINIHGTAPSMFEPVHGSAPDIAGQQKADPTAAILSGALLLERYGRPGAAARIHRAVWDDVAAHAAGPSARSTAQVGDDIAAALA
ncbi:MULTISPECIES: 3-isopropylmalate dehydrogenase [Citricoccus]|uniref:3-isopropylmalate dehydrogenase n=1 Tax=Citricoccus muralis TaxID=169134 RepID=A0ABY8H9A3_9MICC|nr:MULTISPECIES: 3-isopropylmalate dehydrogenase [Citricoccus]WBL18592.1 3-isopropylmalate dehydrogenase [Citricoccus sp. NR2]WFP17730.1 3-isopropylmalate dehydrogenase [Citricoccus muralis]